MEKDDYISGVFREIDEELQSDNILALWQKYKFIVIGVVASILLVTAGWTYYSYANNKANESYTTSYYDFFVKSGVDPLKAIEDAEKNDDLSSHRAFLAKIYEASLLVDHKKYQEAEALYTSIIQDKKTPKIYKDLAVYYEVLNKADYMSSQDLLGAIDALHIDGNPFSPLILELKASNLHKQSRKDEAIAILDDILLTENLPQSFVQRVEVMRVNFQNN